MRQIINSFYSSKDSLRPGKPHICQGDLSPNSQELNVAHFFQLEFAACSFTIGVARCFFLMGSGPFTIAWPGEVQQSFFCH